MVHRAKVKPDLLRRQPVIDIDAQARRRDRSIERARQSIEERPRGFRRAVVVEIDMVTEREAHHSFRLIAKLKQFFAKPDRHDTVLLAVQNEQRCPDFPDPLVRPEGILDEPADRYERIG